MSEKLLRMSSSDEPYDPSDSDYSDSESSNKDKTIEKLRTECTRLRDERNRYSGANYWLKYDKYELDRELVMKNKEIETLKAELETATKKTNGIKEYIKTMGEYKSKCLAFEATVAKLTSELKTTSDKLAEKAKLNECQQNVNKLKDKKWSEEKCKLDQLIDGLRLDNNSLIDAKQRLDTEVSDIRVDKQELELKNEKLTKKVEKLKTNFHEVIDKNNKLQEKCDNNNIQFKTKYHEMKTKCNKLSKENTSLKSQRKYFETHNESHKRKWVSAEFADKKSRGLYASELRKMNEFSTKNNSQLRNELIEIIGDKFMENENKIKENTAQTVLDIRDKSEEIQKSAQKIREKTSDGRVPCGSCDQTFATTGDLRHHMTSKHNMRLNDTTCNDIEIIDLI